MGGCERVSWDQRFFDPIMLPGRKPLVTLRDAALYVTKLPKAEQQAPQWQAAAEVLMLIGEHGGDSMMAHIAMTRALQRHSKKRHLPRAGNAPRPTGSFDKQDHAPGSTGSRVGKSNRLHIAFLTVAACLQRRAVKLGWCFFEAVLNEGIGFIDDRWRHGIPV